MHWLRLGLGVLDHYGEGKESIMNVAWSDLNNVQVAGRYPFRDGFITVLELEIAAWRGDPNTRFQLMRKHPIREQVGYVLGRQESSREPNMA